MRKEDICYRQTYSAEYFEQRLAALQGTYDSGTAIAAIRRELEYDGFFLSPVGKVAPGT